MALKDFDIVYFVKESPTNEELRYSVRSVAKNMPCRKVWFYGGCPNGLKPDGRAKTAQAGNTKWDKVKSMYRLVCLNPEISEDFVLFNDDFYIMRKIEKLDTFYRCDLAEHILTLESKFSDKPNEYTMLLRKAYRTLDGLGLPKRSYELHIPMVFNKHRLLEVLGAFPDVHCMRTLYGNYYNLGGSQTEDVKVFDKNQEPGNGAFLSSEDGSFVAGSKIVTILQEKFPDKCKYEV